MIDEVASRRQPVHAVASRGGGRVRSEEGVAWLGLEEGAGDVIETADMVAATCPADVTVGAPPRRTASAHLTIARRVDGELLEALRTRSGGSLRVAWTIDHIALVRSHLGPGGSRYETLHEVPL